MAKKRDGTSVFFAKDKFEKVQQKTVRKCNGVLVKLQLKSSPLLLTIVAVHLKAKDGNEKVRENQVKTLVQELKDFSKGTIVVICGDFNDIPDSLAFKAVKTVENLNSAYSYYDNTNIEPFTTYKERSCVVKRCIDYIFFDKTALVPLQLLEIPHLDVPLPRKDYPSDHLAISAIFGFKK